MVAGGETVFWEWEWAGLGWAGLGWAGLGWAWLGWAGLGWVIIGVTPFRVLMTLLITYLLSPLPLQVEARSSGLRGPFPNSQPDLRSFSSARGAEGELSRGSF